MRGSGLAVIVTARKVADVRSMGDFIGKNILICRLGFVGGV